MIDGMTSRLLVLKRRGSFFGLSAHRVREIISKPRRETLPLMPEWITGVFEYNDSILPNLDLPLLGGFISAQGSSETDSEYYIVFDDNISFSIAADIIIGIVDFDYQPTTREPEIDPSKAHLPMHFFEYRNHLLSIPQFSSWVEDDTMSERASYCDLTPREKNLVTFYVGGRRFSLETTSVYRIADADWTPNDDGQTHPRSRYASLAEVFGITAPASTRTLVIERDGWLCGLGVDAIARTSFANHRVYPLPMLLPEILGESFYDGIASDTARASLLAVLDPQGICEQIA